MTKTEAAKLLIREARQERLTLAGLKRVRRACEALGLTEGETMDMEEYLEFRDSTGTLHPYLKPKK